MTMRQLNVRIDEVLDRKMDDFIACLDQYDPSELPTQVLFEIRIKGKTAIVNHALRAFMTFYSTERF